MTQSTDRHWATTNLGTQTSDAGVNTNPVGWGRPGSDAPQALNSSGQTNINDAVIVNAPEFCNSCKLSCENPKLKYC